jgi:hypothetical protein
MQRAESTPAPKVRLDMVVVIMVVLFVTFILVVLGVYTSSKGEI